MDRELKMMIFKTFGGLAIFIILGYFFFNGFGNHPYERNELESLFLDQAKTVGVLGEEEYALIEEEHANGISFLLQTESGERACATYTRDLFVDKFKENSFYSGRVGVLSVDAFTYRVNDNAMMYDVTFLFGDTLDIIPAEVMTPIMYYKAFGICIVAMGFFAGRIFFGKRLKK